ncbi:MAG TPA: DUF5313 family protein [Pseudonocardiaceae bacterium]|jgi:hypothetical protein|nr:DUF5313 family protein [Pseudonocardiaceae bacterium]
MDVRRPNAAQWLWYAFGGKLPQRYREWVLRDITRPHWLGRHTVRSLVQSVPPLLVLCAVLVYALHLALWIGLAALAIGLIVSVYYNTSYAWEHGDHRLKKYGYPAGYGSHVREELAREKLLAQEDAYNAQWRS